MSATPPVVLSIAGFDPSSGAGVTADIKTIAAYGCYGVACITALTVQSTAGVKGVHPLPGELVRRTLDELVADLPIAAVRVGMLGSEEVAEALAGFLQARPLPNVVLDPVLKASSGASLLDEAGVRVLAERLLPLSAVITPNVEEAAVLSGLPVTQLSHMKAAARRLHELGATAVVITGGHLPEALDLLSVRAAAGVEQEELRAPRVASRSTHGTGCAFATALACQLALQQPLRQAVAAAKEFVRAAMAAAYPLGRGAGPLHHLYRFDK